jgi:hypothetical protein
LRRETLVPKLVGRRLSRHVWTYLEPHEIEARNVIIRWLIRSAVNDKDIEVEGTFDGLYWVPVSQWLLDEWRRAEIRARAAEGLRRDDDRSHEGASVKELAAAMCRVREMCVRKPRRGEAAYHLVKHVKIDPDCVAEIMELAGYDDVLGKDLPDMIKYGGRRKGGCRFCDLAR